MDDCIFCKIIKGEIPCRKVYEDESVLAFDDIHPMAPVHVVIIPKRHLATLLDVGEDTLPVVDAMIRVAQEVARRKGIDKRGFRTVINCNEEGGQVIFHLHMHLLGGRKLADGLG
ncbi:MAG TPA: histidine triad nucleotide-binding protein [Syntrophales bacterium]|nr:histidine triad nucleotide-binding protein [Syntrophales bacterium]